MKDTTTLLALLALSVVSAVATSAFPGHLRTEADGAQRRKLDAAGGNYMNSEFFSEHMSDGDKVVILEAGPFRLEATCQTYEHDYSHYYSYYTYSGYYNSTYNSYYSYPYYYNSTTSSFFYGPYDSYIHYFAGLNLYFEATTADYVYGEPAWPYFYPYDAPTLVGSYEAGETRNATVFRGYSGAAWSPITLSSLSGYYLSVPADQVIGIHRGSADWMHDDGDSFPEGIDCMISGFVVYVGPSTTRT